MTNSSTTGRHVLGELHGVAFDVLNDLAFLRSTMIEHAIRIGMQVLNAQFHQFEPQGVTGTLLLSESHAACHTWPEAGYMSIDIYTCGEADPNEFLDAMVEVLSPRHVESAEICRGVRNNLKIVPEKTNADKAASVT